jgi:hypothetical protein
VAVKPGLVHCKRFWDLLCFSAYGSSMACSFGLQFLLAVAVAVL